MFAHPMKKKSVSLVCRFITLCVTRIARIMTHKTNKEAKKGEKVSVFVVGVFIYESHHQSPAWLVYESWVDKRELGENPKQKLSWIDRFQVSIHTFLLLLSAKGVWRERERERGKLEEELIDGWQKGRSEWFQRSLWCFLASFCDACDGAMAIFAFVGLHGCITTMVGLTAGKCVTTQFISQGVWESLVST